MPKQLLIYDRVVPISSDSHRDWSVKITEDYSFSRPLNSVPLLAAEFLSASQDYAIVFASSEDSVFPAVLLGFEDGKNLFVSDDGAWGGGYVPAFLRRYPFVFAEDVQGENGKFTLCIDEEYSGLNKEGRGERLFDSDGNRTQFLQTMLTFVSQFQAQFNRTREFCNRLNKLGLLEPAQARFTTAEGRTGTLGGFLTIVRDRLKAIPEVELKEMFSSDELELCYAHLHSLQNVNRLGSHMQSKPAGLAEPMEIAVADTAADEPAASETAKDEVPEKAENHTKKLTKH
ncbi:MULTISPECIES: SapC family protein [unclassified Yoonia]|uniref:SapC family protein n=1 Tax=unclassified Yoonia TaxID=2629118 RepID=UPI002AFE5450|nr:MULTISPECIES: SapC family protein [unclassified Yoonia]